MRDNDSTGTAAIEGVSRAPQTREELEAFMLTSPMTKATVLTKQWISLEAEFAKLADQLDHINSTFPDELLTALLEAQTGSLRQALRRRADDLAGMPATHVVDTCCKCYMRKRILAITPVDALAADRLMKSIRDDLDQFGLDSATAKAECA